MNKAPLSVNSIKNVAKYIGHTYSEKLEVKVLIKYNHQLNKESPLNQLHIELVQKIYKKSTFR